MSSNEHSAVTEKKIVFKQVTVEESVDHFGAHGYPPATATDIVEGFSFWDEFSYYGGQPTSKEGLARPTRTLAKFAKSAG
ncbi:hypothetical protein B0H19DRAFT_1271036 [Mycena capillaripes]|nr:hypothetical protein B0H19DRAFT_1271036 [Mycena capillaripes]